MGNKVRGSCHKVTARAYMREWRHMRSRWWVFFLFASLNIRIEKLGFTFDWQQFYKMKFIICDQVKWVKI